MASRKNQPWTIEEIEKVIELRWQGVRPGAIAQRIGRTVDAVYFQISKHARGKVVPRYSADEWIVKIDRMEALYLKGVEMSEIAKIYSTRTATVTRMLARRGLDEETRAEETTDADVR